MKRRVLDEPCNKGSVEPAAVLLITPCEFLLSLRSQKCLFLAVDFVLASVKVSLVRLDALRLHEELVAEDADEVDGDTLRVLLATRISVD